MTVCCAFLLTLTSMRTMRGLDCVEAAPGPACSVAAILKECRGTTRSSWSAVVMHSAGKGFKDES